MPELDADLVAAYSATRITTVDGLVLAGPGAVVALPCQSPAYVLTAWNPFSRKAADGDNERAQAVLRSRVTSRLVADVVAESPGGDWQEGSLLVTGLGREEAMALAVEFAQHAFFELDGDTLRVVSADGRVLAAVTRRTGPAQ